MDFQAGDIDAIAEEQLHRTSTDSPREAAARDAMAAALVAQIDLLRDADGSALVRGRPAWANWDTGAWPSPHDPVFDFATPIDGFQWIDDAANAAAAELREAAVLLPVVGHSDWV